MTDLTFVNPHRISVAQFMRVLERAQSPAAVVAAQLADIPGVYGLDRGVALAFFGHESTYGTQGITKTYDTKNWGNLRRPFLPIDNHGTQFTPAGRGPFARYPTWQDGLADWCALIRTAYVTRRKLATVGAALAVYAPSNDGNAPARYAAAVAQLVAQWQAEDAAHEGPAGQLYDSDLGPTTTPTGPRSYRTTARTNVRQGPGTTFPVACVLVPNELVTTDAVLLGVPVNGDPRWAHLADGRGFVHLSLLKVSPA